MTPCYCMIGTNTAQQSVPPSIMLAETRKPVNAPAARKTGSHSNRTVRPVQRFAEDDVHSVFPIKAADRIGLQR